MAEVAKVDVDIHKFSTVNFVEKATLVAIIVNIILVGINIYETVSGDLP